MDAFFDHPSFIDSNAAVAEPLLAKFKPDHVMFSFHGLPEWQVRELDVSGSHCLVKPDCCDAVGASLASDCVGVESEYRRDPGRPGLGRFGRTRHSGLRG